MSIIGQNKILEKINVSIPRILLLSGDKGSGKHLISKYISDILKLDMLDISLNISRDIIYDIYYINIYMIHIVYNMIDIYIFI